MLAATLAVFSHPFPVLILVLILGTVALDFYLNWTKVSLSSSDDGASTDGRIDRHD